MMPSITWRILSSSVTDLLDLFRKLNGNLLAVVVTVELFNDHSSLWSVHW